MINFRYHIVSITAVFLALAIGTALGSTFLDGPTVDLLNRNIRNAEDRIEATNAENSRLSDLNDEAGERDQSLLNDASERLVSGFLTDVPVLVLVAPGVDTDEAAGVAQMVASSGADFRGSVAMREAMRFEGDLDEELATALDLQVADQEELGDEVYRLLHEAMLAAGQEPVDSPDATDGGAGAPADPSEAEGDQPDETQPDETQPGESQPDETQPGESQPDETQPSGDPTGEGQPDQAGEPGDATDGPPVLDGTQPAIVTELVERGYLAVDRPSGAPESILEVEGYRFVMVSDDEADQVDLDAALRFVGAGETTLPMVVVTPTPPADGDAPEAEASQPMGLVGLIRDDADLEARVNTVDGIDTFSGLIAMMIVLEDIHVTSPGHHGQADGSSSVVPTPR